MRHPRESGDPSSSPANRHSREVLRRLRLFRMTHRALFFGEVVQGDVAGVILRPEGPKDLTGMTEFSPLPHPKHPKPISRHPSVGGAAQGWGTEADEKCEQVVDTAEACKEVDDCAVLDEKLAAVGDHVDRVGWTRDAMARKQCGTFV